MIVTHETFEDGVLIDAYEVEVPDLPDPVPVDAGTLIANVAAMTDDQKADLRAALGL